MEKEEQPRAVSGEVRLPMVTDFDGGLPASASNHRKWGAFRYSVIGPLLHSPPDPGRLGVAIRDLSEKTWKHPVTGNLTSFAPATIEGWYYRAKKEEKDPVGSLNRRRRKDTGHQRVLDEPLVEQIKNQYRDYSWWTVELHHKNLIATLKKEDPSAHLPSYSTILRHFRRSGLRRKPRPRVNEKGELDGLPASDTKEIALFEAEHVNQLWALDFHHGKLRVLSTDGTWVQPVLCTILDHCSRLACNAYWGLFESTKELVHCYSVAVMKRGRSRKCLMDNGGAMKSGEFRQGLARLGIAPAYIKPRTPRQNGKIEHFWGSLESNLIDMIRGQEGLTLGDLNKATQAWIEIGYNRKVHREINARPIDRFLSTRNVGKPPVDEETLKRAFRVEETRRPRSSDGVIRIERIPFRLPERFRHLSEVSVRYARWDLGFVHLVDSVTGQELERIFPVDKESNASGERRKLEDPVSISQDKTRTQIPPLLKEQIDTYERMTETNLGLDKDQQ